MECMFNDMSEDSDDNDCKKQREYKDQQIGKIRYDVVFGGKVVFDIEVCIRFGQAEQRESLSRSKCL